MTSAASPTPSAPAGESARAGESATAGGRTPTGAPRTVIVTGGAGGIGKGIAAEFIAEGDRVLLVDRDAAAAHAAATEVGGEAVALDITDAAAVAAAFDGALGEADVLVNNAGILSVHGTVTELDPEAYRSILEVNVIGTYTMIQAFAKRRIDAGDAGANASIVNISSIGGRQPTPGMGAYESSKAAVDSITRWAAIELSAHGIRVNAVAPGPVLTPMLQMGMPEGSPAREAWAQRIPLGDLAKVEDIAPAVVFLAGAKASHITGVSLAVDGGQLLT